MDSHINQILDSAAGRAQKSQGESLSTFLASLTASLVILVVGISLYIALWYRAPQYQPPSLPHWLRSTSSSPRAFFTRCQSDSKAHFGTSVDNYFFHRYLQVLAKLFILLGLVVAPAIIPINLISGGKNGVGGLDRMSISNISSSHTQRYWAHLVLAIFVVVTTCGLIFFEILDHGMVLRQRQSRAVASSLFVTTSKGHPSTTTIQQRFHGIAGGAHSVIALRDYKQLYVNIGERDNALERLEIAESLLIKRSSLNQRSTLPAIFDTSSIVASGKSEQRPTLRQPLNTWLPALPFIGKKVDAIQHLRSEVSRLNAKLEWDQLHPENFPLTGSYFVQLRQRIPSRLAAIGLSARIPPSWTVQRGTTASDVLWENLSSSRLNHLGRHAVANILMMILTIGFSIPVFLWIRSIPVEFIATIQGVLPPLFLALVTAAVPLIIRILITIKAIHSRREHETQVQIYYFVFMFFQGFLNISLSAGIITVISELDRTIDAVPAVLAQNLPKASNYFLSYIIINTITTFVVGFVQAKEFFGLLILSPVFDKTPRQRWHREEGLKLQSWGTFLPLMTNVACIGVIYAVIAPFVLPLTAMYFTALSILYHCRPPKLSESDLESDGVFYDIALRQLFTGVYFLEVCMSGLFFLVRNNDNEAACTPQAIIMLIVMALTVIFHLSMDWTCSLYLKYFGKLDDCNHEFRFREQLSDSISQVSIRRPVIWIPRDGAGFAERELSQIRMTRGLQASTVGASIDGQGRLKITGQPPQ